MKTSVNYSGKYYSNNNGLIYRGSSDGILPIYNVDGDQPIHCIGYHSYADLSGGRGDESCQLNGVGLLAKIPSVKAEDHTDYTQCGENHSFTSVKEVEAKILFDKSHSFYHNTSNGCSTELIISCQEGTEIEKAMTTLFGEGWSNGIYRRTVVDYNSCSCAYQTTGNREGWDKKHTHDRDYNLLKGMDFFCPFDPTKGFKEKKKFDNCSVEEQLNAIISAYQAGVTKASLEYCHKAYWEDTFTIWHGNSGNAYAKVVVSDLEKYFALIKSEGLESTLKSLTKKITDLVLLVGYHEAMRLVRKTKSMSLAMKIAKGKNMKIVSRKKIGYEKIKSFIPQFLWIAA